MPNLNSFLADIKRAALEAVMAAKPFSLTFGTVVSTSPLRINVDQKLTLAAEQLILTNAVRDYSASIKVDNNDKNISFQFGLKTGERVILLRADGGQQYLVLDRVEAPKI